MKYLGFFIIIIAWLFCSCNHNDEPALEVNLPIRASFIPVSIEINKNEIDEKEREEIMNLVNNKHIVNNVSEIPNDPLRQNEAFYNINYEENTLLITYLFKIWTFDTYSNRFYKNTKENSYNWVVRLGVTGDQEKEAMTLTRFAIIVKKLPSDAYLETWYSLNEL